MAKSKSTARKPKPRRKPPRAAATLPIERWCDDLVQPDTTRRRSVHIAVACLGELVAMRAREDGVSRSTAWRHIFDVERLHADLDNTDSTRRTTAERAVGALAIMLLRREVANASNSRKVRLFELASLARQSANEEIAQVIGDPGLDLEPN